MQWSSVSEESCFLSTFTADERGAANSYGDRTFAAARPRLWNSLPSVQLRNPEITYTDWLSPYTDCSDEGWRDTFFRKYEHGALWLLICGAIEKHGRPTNLLKRNWTRVCELQPINFVSLHDRRAWRITPRELDQFVQVSSVMFSSSVWRRLWWRTVACCKQLSN